MATIRSGTEVPSATDANYKIQQDGVAGQQAQSEDWAQASQGINTAGSVTKSIGKISQGAALLTAATPLGGVFSAISAGCEIAGVACDVGAGATGAVSAGVAGDELGATSAGVGAVASGVNYGISESQAKADAGNGEEPPFEEPSPEGQATMELANGK